MSLNMWGKWILSNSGERYLDSIDLVMDDPSKVTKREALAYFILGGIKGEMPLTAIQRVLETLGIKNPHRVLQSSLEDYERNRWVKETEEDYTSEEMNTSDLTWSTKDSDSPPDFMSDFKDHY